MNSIAKSHFVQSRACNMAPDNPPSPKTFVIRMEDKRLKMYTQDRILKKLATGTLLPTHQVMAPDGKWIEIAKCPGFRTFCAKIAAMEGEIESTLPKVTNASDMNSISRENLTIETGFPEPEKKRGESPNPEHGGSSDSLIIFKPSKVAKIPRPLVKNPNALASPDTPTKDVPTSSPSLPKPEGSSSSEDPNKVPAKGKIQQGKRKFRKRPKPDSTFSIHRFMPEIIKAVLLVLVMTGSVIGGYMALKDIQWGNTSKSEKGIPEPSLPNKIPENPDGKDKGPLVPIPPENLKEPASPVQEEAGGEHKEKAPEGPNKAPMIPIPDNSITPQSFQNKAKDKESAPNPPEKAKGYSDQEGKKQSGK